MNETKLRTIAQLEEFIKVTSDISFSGIDSTADNNERYEHITRVLTRFDYPHRNKHERGVVLAYLQRTSGYSRAQIQISGMVQKPLFSGNTGVAIPPSKVRDFSHNGELTGAFFVPFVSASQRLRLPEPKQREPMRMCLARLQLLGTFSNTLSKFASQKGSMVQEEL